MMDLGCDEFFCGFQVRLGSCRSFRILGMSVMLKVVKMRMIVISSGLALFQAKQSSLFES